MSLAFENPINKMVRTAVVRLSQTQSLNFLLAIVTKAGKICDEWEQGREEEIIQFLVQTSFGIAYCRIA